MKLKQKLLSLALAGVMLLGGSSIVANAQGQWTNQNGHWYYSDNGTYSKGWSKINGQWYFFNSNAEMHTGWLNEGGYWYYLNNSGAMHKGWLQQGSSWYYLNSDGCMINYTTTIDDKTQRFNSNGVWLGEQANNSNETSSNSANESTIVWRASSSTKYYHSSSICSNMKSPIKMTLKEALNKHLEACPKCH